MAGQICNDVVNKDLLNIPELRFFKGVTFAFMAALYTLGILSVRHIRVVTWNAFATILQEFPEVLSAWLLFITLRSNSFQTI